MRCTPQECDLCSPWGEGVPGKTRCLAPPYPKDCNFRFSTALGGQCVIEKERERGEQQTLWGDDE